MNPYRYEFSLLFHPTMDPQDISLALHQTPRIASKAGTPRTTPTGQALEGVNESTYWCSSPAKREGYDLAAALAAHLSTIEPYRDFLARFSSTGGTIEYFVGWFTDGLNVGEMFDWEI